MLPLLNDLNKAFQADKLKVGILILEMTRLLRKFMCKFIKMQVIKNADLTEIDFSNRLNQLNDDELAIGMHVACMLYTFLAVRKLHQPFNESSCSVSANST